MTNRIIKQVGPHPCKNPDGSSVAWICVEPALHLLSDTGCEVQINLMFRAMELRGATRREEEIVQALVAERDLVINKFHHGSYG